jgi:hypothetical protein
LLVIGIGVLVLVLLGVAAYLVLADGDGGDGTAVALTGPGSASQPHDRTTGVEVFYPDGDVDQRWVIEVLEPVRDASAEAAAPPGGGNVFAVTRVRVRNQDGVEGASLTDLSFNAVTADGEVIERQTTACSTADDGLDFGAILSVGAEAEGSVCWEVPAAALNGVLLGIESAKVGGRVHISLQ